MQRYVYAIMIASLCLISSAWGNDNNGNNNGNNNDKDNGKGMRLEGIENSHPSFYVRVSVNHENHQYKEGDYLKVNVRSSEDGFLYLFYEDTHKNVVLLFPNQFEPDNSIQKNTDITVPSANQNFRIRTSEPFGSERLLGVVTKKPLEISKSISLSRNATPISPSYLNDFKKELSGEHSSEDKSKNWAEQSIIITTFSASTTTAPQPEQNASKRYLVTVCVSKYKNLPAASLPACRPDAEEIVKTFTQIGIDPKNIVSLYDEDVTMQKVKELFCEFLPKATKPGDEIIIYWTGHGGQCSDVNGDEKKSGYDSTLILYDSKRNEPQTQLIDDDFGYWIQKLDGRKVLIIFDACYSAGQASSKSFGTGRWMFGFDEACVMKDLGQRDLAIIASSSSSQQSFVRQENDMSVMTYYFTQALKTQKSWTHSTIFEKIRPEVKEYAKKTYYGSDQDMEIQDDMKPAMILN